MMTKQNFYPAILKTETNEIENTQKKLMMLNFLKKPCSVVGTILTFRYIY